jgi:hypothetical protein
LAQDVLSLVQGQGFGNAFASGFLGSIGASAFGAVAGKFASSAVGTIAFGAVAGGIGSELTGGNFWQGALIGGVVAGFNHVMHKMDSSELDVDKNPDRKKKRQSGKEKKVLKGKIVKVSLDIVDGLSKTNGLNSSKLLGTAGDISGKAAPLLEVGINVYSYKSGLTGPGEFLYDTVGTGTSLYVGAETGAAAGGPAGFVAGAAAGLAFEGVKYITKTYIVPTYKKIEYKILNPITNKFRNSAFHGYR